MNAPPGRTRPRRRSVALEMQQRAFVQLTIATVVIFVVVMAAAFLFVAPIGGPSIRGVAPVLGAFMEAGQRDDALAGHALLSVRGLRVYSREDVATLFADRWLFDEYAKLRVTGFTMEEQDDPFVSVTARTTAIVEYHDGPPGRLEADLDYDETDWRLRRIDILRGTESP